MSETTTGAAAVFLDRDGTINQEIGYVTRPEDIQLIDGVGQALRRLRAAGYLLVVVTNQACLAKGMLDESVLREIHNSLESLLAEEAVKLDGIYFCGDHPDGTVDKYPKQSDRRKPAPGMLLEAAEELGIDLSKSWMVGDSAGDVQAGSGVGCRTILLTPSPQAPEQDDVPADFTATNLLEAAEIIISQDIGSAVSEQPSPKQDQLPTAVRDENIRLLTDIIRELRHQRVNNQHREFSVGKMLAGMLQCTVFLCLVMSYVAFSYWTEKSLYVCLAVALILQTMVVALLLLHPSR